MDKEEETVVASLDPNINDVEDFTLPPQRMDIKAEDLIPYLYKGKRWDPRLLSALKGLLSKGFIGISRSFEKIDFFANNEDIILTLVTLIFPLFISPEVGFGKVEELPPPFVPFDFMRPFFIKHMKSELVKHKTTFFYEANCGASLNMKHMRISIAHYKPNMVANWFWKLFTCLNFIQLSRIVINEELGDGIRFKSGVAAEDPKGTVAAYFGKDGSYYALTARHVMESIWKQAEQGFLIDNGDRPIEISRIPEELEYEEIPTTFGANSPNVFVGATCVIDWLGGLQFNLTNN